MVVVQQQRTTVATLMRFGFKKSGAIQWIQMYCGRNVTSRSVVSPKLNSCCSYILNLFYSVKLWLNSDWIWYSHAELEANDLLIIDIASTGFKYFQNIVDTVVQ